MRTKRLLIAAFLCSTALVVGAAWSFAGTTQVAIRDVDAGAFPVVTLTVSVAGNVGSSEISVQEDGRPVRSPSITSLGTLSQSIDVVLVLDTSGSMQGAPIAAAVQAAQTFLDDAGPSVRIGLLTFADKAKILTPITGDHAAASRALNKVATGGNTSLFDAVAAAARMFSATDQHNIVLLTDGGDTTSTFSLPSAIDAARKAHAAIFSIGLKTPETDVASLQKLSVATDGQYVAAATADLTQVYQQILTVLNSQFRITYRSSARAGTIAKISVSALGASATYVLQTPKAVVPPSLKPTHTPAPGIAAPPAKPVLSGAWGLLLALGLAFLGVYALVLMLLLPGVRVRRERDLAKRVGVPAAPDRMTDRTDRSLGAYLPTLVAVGDRLAGAGGWTLAMEAALERAGLPITPGELVTASGLAVVVGAVVGGLAFRTLIMAAIFAVVIGLIPFGIVQISQRRRVNKLHEQLPDVLMILATSLRAGHSFLQALDTVSKEAADPGAREFTRVVAEIRLGRPLSEAMNAMADRVGSEDFRWAVLAVNIQRDVGGNLAEVLDTVAETLRERDAVRRQIDSLSAEGKLSLYVLMALPIFIGLWVYKFNREYLSPLFHTSGGLAMLGGSIVLMVAGYLWMRKIVSIDV
jgi:tight adherence protein B